MSENKDERIAELQASIDDRMKHYAVVREHAAQALQNLERLRNFLEKETQKDELYKALEGYLDAHEMVLESNFYRQAEVILERVDELVDLLKGKKHEQALWIKKREEIDDELVERLKRIYKKFGENDLLRDEEKAWTEVARSHEKWSKENGDAINSIYATLANERGVVVGVTGESFEALQAGVAKDMQLRRAQARINKDDKAAKAA